MSEYGTDIIFQMNKLNIELKQKLEMVLKWRVECAELQLEFLKLYTPECLTILNELKQLGDTNNESKEKSSI
ncbi:uncharacterized protein LOC143147618 [Ptiloglossa arizonensis]|uniref:uncharacterized protein LOC143147618 n=1 Tax=Ptiloglossa arizonensis TaxID=3350558 RepID=UPI003F9FC304